MLQQQPQATLPKYPEGLPKGAAPSVPLPLNAFTLKQVTGGAGETTAPGKGW